MGTGAGLDERIEAVTGEIEELSRVEATFQRLMSVPGIGPLISTGLVAAIGTGEAFERGRDFGAWLGLVPRQYSTGGRSILGRIELLLAEERRRSTQNTGQIRRCCYARPLLEASRQSSTGPLWKRGGFFVARDCGGRVKSQR
jgi:transposase